MYNPFATWASHPACLMLRANTCALVDLMSRGSLLMLLLITLPATAQIHVYTDAHGNTAYSSRPPDGVESQVIEPAPLNTLAPPTSPTTAQAAPRTENTHAYSTLELTGLPTHEALRANNGTFTVDVRIEPHLQEAHRLRLLLDGQPYGQPSNVPRLQLVNIDRGEHSLAVQVLAGDTPVQQSPAITFSLQRARKP